MIQGKRASITESLISEQDSEEEPSVAGSIPEKKPKATKVCKVI